MKPKSGVQVGGTSIIMVFILLCLTVFAVLTLQSASADLRLANKSAEASTRYYEADAEAERILAQIDEVLYILSESAVDESSYRANLTRAAADLGLPVTISGQTLTYSVPAGVNQRLEVGLELPWPATEERIKRVKWAVTAIEQSGEDAGDGVNIFIPGLWNP